jgi:HAD superfamily hydrolase (TIGR01549 family)
MFAQELGYELSDRKYLKKFEVACMTDAGTINEHVMQLLADLKVAPQAELIRNLQDLMLESISTQSIYPDTVLTLDSLRKDYQLSLISNTFKEGFDALRQKYPIDGWFTDVLLSYEVGAIKPSMKSFEALLRQTNLKPTEVLMVGDDYHDDVLAANEAGIAAVLVDRKGRYPDVIDRKISELNQLDQYLRA